jgi:hypothetical protein
MLILLRLRNFKSRIIKERPWVSYVLEGCCDKEEAFMNWMKRDILLADEVREQCDQMGYKTLANDGSLTIDEPVKKSLYNSVWRDNKPKEQQ